MRTARRLKSVLKRLIQTFQTLNPPPPSLPPPDPPQPAHPRPRVRRVREGPEFPKPGNPTLAITPRAPNFTFPDRRSTVQPLSSVITGLAEAATQPRPTGTGLSAPVSPRSPDEARAWLVGQRPADVDDKIRRSLTSQLGVSVSENREWRFPEGKPPYQVSISAGLTGLSTENRSAALAKVEAAMTPVTREQAEKMIGQLGSVLARRSSSEETAEIAFDIYVSVLMSHPADVAAEVVRTLCTEPREGGKTAWLPSPPEVESLCRALSASRTALAFALRNWREVSPEEMEVTRLEDEWRRLQAVATELGGRVGPGPASDTGPRGERIAAHDAAIERAGAAKIEWLASVKKISA